MKTMLCEPTPYMLVQYNPTAHKVLTADIIIDTIVAVFNVNRRELKSHSRKREFVNARFAAIYLIKKYIWGMTLKRLGNLFGDRDHATIIYAIQTAKDLLATDKNFRINVELAERLMNTKRNG